MYRQCISWGRFQSLAVRFKMDSPSADRHIMVFLDLHKQLFTASLLCYQPKSLSAAPTALSLTQSLKDHFFRPSSLELSSTSFHLLSLLDAYSNLHHPSLFSGILKAMIFCIHREVNSCWFLGFAHPQRPWKEDYAKHVVSCSVLLPSCCVLFIMQPSSSGFCIQQYMELLHKVISVSLIAVYKQFHSHMVDFHIHCMLLIIYFLKFYFI